MQRQVRELLLSKDYPYILILLMIALRQDNLKAFESEAPTSQ